ncbi:DNA-3-methyladenine glycosylase [Phaeodactylibacter luteus]|uniref:Putative 3-methyladenine DNA glycosylase n=2 Tax=Phaeodactylibacter luteus TaxID=1564516 RepID=A0A5C6RLK4_9BACT|nr:DNA-3-methyladenine glycosylase [Phaeodactylibacter luteus]
MTPTLPQRIPRSFFLEADVLQASNKLLGHILATSIGGIVARGRIVEVEAYRGSDDKACHAYGNKRTPRTEVMFGQGGHAYVYLCYGIHHLFNIVTGPAGQADAVLIRALEPLPCSHGHMLKRRGMEKVQKRLTAGPGMLSQAMGITTALSGADLAAADSPVWLEWGSALPTETAIARSPRIGVGYAEECAAWPWRFTIKQSPWLSR